MAKKKNITNIKISDFPEEITREGIKVYGETSYENSIAVLSHYLHNHNGEASEEEKAKIITAVREFLHRKQFCQGLNEELSDDEVWRVAEDAAQYDFFSDFFDIPFPAPKNPNFTFIDLFAGIGGFRIAMQNLGGKCVYSSEFDAKAQESYFANYGEMPFGDITKESTKSYIPDGFDVLCAGFPCQAFSLAGKRMGFNETRGTLFFDVAEILRRKRPKAFFLENVKGLVIHDKGKTFKTIINTLKELGYVVPEPKIVNAMYFGVPQHRERVYIVGFRDDLGVRAEDFEYPEQKDVTKCFMDIREKKAVPAKYYLSNTYLETLRRHKARHEAKGHGFGYDIVKNDEVANAIVVGGMGRERNLVIDKRQKDLTPTTNIKGEYNTEGIRRMTPREWARLQGFPDEFKIVVADASAYKQFGNSVAIPAIQATAERELQMLGII